MSVSAFDPVAFLDDAVPIASHEDVTGMRAFLVETLADHGVEATVDDAGNTLATRGGDVAAEADAGGGPHVALNTHIDTVSPHLPHEWGDGVIRGRGSCDAKGPLAALLSAFLAVDDDAPGRVTLAVTPDEEALSTGAAALDLDADAYVVGEPTGLDVCTAAKGRFQGTVTLSGASAHAAEPDSGVNAVAAAARALDALDTYDEGREAHPQLGAATLTATTVEGGQATNQVPAECRLVVDRRSVPPETASEFRDGLRAHLRDAVPDAVGVEFALTDRETPFLEAWSTPADGPLARTVAAAAREAGGSGETRPFTAATEASYFSPAPTVVFGPGVLSDEEGAVAHSDREYVRTADVRRAADALRMAVPQLLRDL